MERIIDPSCDDGIGLVDPLVDLWRDHLIVQKKKIWWESLYEMDLAGRGIGEFANEVPRQADETGGSVHGMMEEMKRLVEEAIKKMEKKMDDIAREMKAMIGDVDERLDVVECYVNEQRSKRAHDRVGPRILSPSPASKTTHDDEDEGGERDDSDEGGEGDDSDEGGEGDASDEGGKGDDSDEGDEEPAVREHVPKPDKKRKRKETPEQKLERKRMVKPSAVISSPFIPGQAAKGGGKGKGKKEVKTKGKGRTKTTKKKRM